MAKFAIIPEGTVVYNELLAIAKSVKHGNNYGVNRVDVHFNTSTDRFEFETVCVNEYGGAYGNEDKYTGFLSRLSKEAYSELLRYAF